MKSNKLLIVLAFCAAMQPGISFGSQAYYQHQRYAPPSQSYWQRMKNYAASWVPQPVKYVGSMAARNKGIMLDRIDDFFQPSIVREYKQAIRDEIEILNKIYLRNKEILNKIYLRNKSNIHNIPLDVSKSDRRDYRAAVKLREIVLYGKAREQGFTPEYLFKIQNRLAELYPLNGEMLRKLGPLVYYYHQ
jgi:hypothetical protein